MNAQQIADPFDTPAPAKAGAGRQRNAAALGHLRREIIAGPFDEAEQRARLVAMNGQRKLFEPEIDISESLRDGQASAASAEWDDLDKLAMTRAAVWIVQADGFGVSISSSEHAEIASRDPERIAISARKIVRRLSETVAAPDADATVVSGSDALAEIMPKAE